MAPPDPGNRDHSIPYLVAVALQDGVVTPASFDPQRILDPALRALISKMIIDPNPDFSRRYPDEVNCRLEVTTGAGRTHVAQCVYPKGFPQNPMSDADLEAKFRSCGAALLMASQCDRALERLWSLEAQPNLKELFDTLVVESGFHVRLERRRCGRTTHVHPTQEWSPVHA